MHIRFHTLALCAAATVALAGCGDKKSPDAKASEAAASAKSDTPKPGHWDVNLRMIDFDVPGMPQQMKDSIGQQISKAGAVATCLTPEEAARNDGRFFQPSNNKNCKSESFTMEGGKLAAKLTCTNGPTKQTVDMQGTYGAEAYDLTLESKGEASGQPMKMSMRVTGKRTGECTGKERG